MTDPQAFAEISSRSAAELAEKYVALWNEPDADRRQRMIAELWTEDGTHILQPPQEIRAIAAQPGIAMTAILKARGYKEIEARAASAYEHWVGSEGLSFRGRDDAERLGDVVKFHGSGLMTTVEANGVTLGVEHFGDAGAPLVLLAGGATMLSWPDALCGALARGGRHVVR